MFTKVLIANRGEIAVRVMRGCRELGLRTVAVYSEADKDALHVRMADEAVLIGPPPARESYLVIDKIIAACKATGAEAVHPGYGFLSENPDFAEACNAAGIVFIGPRPEAMRLMGDKTAARRTMREAGVPVTPGDEAGGDGFADADAALAAAKRIGFPIMLKAARGGGGKGMRLVQHDGTPAADQKFAQAFAAARREAASAFGHDGVYLEKAILSPRHVEIQVLADQHGNCVHLFERDCSIQRRHQKVIEETPCPVLRPETRRKMGEVAVKGAKAVGYVGAGTFEFLLDPEGNFYFLEMNTRLQVEHPITEWVTGVDLVHEQLRIAAGDKLAFRQEDLIQRGHSIECRIYAEDPDKGFLPSPGQITSLRTPSGPGVRDDSGVYAGYAVPMFYDPMLAKLSVWAEDRPTAIARMYRALGEYHVGGIKTSVSWHRRVMRHSAFREGRYDTGFIDRHKAELAPPPPDSPEAREAREVALVSAAVEALAQAESQAHAQSGGPPGIERSPWAESARWRS